MTKNKRNGVNAQKMNRLPLNNTLPKCATVLSPNYPIGMPIQRPPHHGGFGSGIMLCSGEMNEHSARTEVFLLLRPWAPLSDEGARYFERELARELSPDHALCNRRFTAVAKTGASDDVLFKIEDGTFAQVHLTSIKTPPERPGWPGFKTYELYRTGLQTGCCRIMLISSGYGLIDGKACAEQTTGFNKFVAAGGNWSCRVGRLRKAHTKFAKSCRSLCRRHRRESRQERTHRRRRSLACDEVSTKISGQESAEKPVDVHCSRRTVSAVHGAVPAQRLFPALG